MTMPVWYARVLLVDDDIGTCETLGIALRRTGLDVHAVFSREQAIAAARKTSYHFAIIDQRLPDGTGLDLAETLNRERVRPPWLLMSGWMDVSLAVAAMKHGAVGVLSLPYDVDDLVRTIAEHLHGRPSGWPVPRAASVDCPRSAVDRIARLILRSCELTRDPRTLHDWAEDLALSRAALAEVCRIVGVPPHEARDFARVLRALSVCRGELASLSAELLVSDHRTLRLLLRRAGLLRRTEGATTFESFIGAQAFIPATHAVIQRLNERVAACS